MCPLVNVLNTSKNLQTLVCVAAQRWRIFDRELNLSAIESEDDVNVMKYEQTFPHLTVNILTDLDSAIREYKPESEPDIVLTFCDTNTAFFVSLASFYSQNAVGHVDFIGVNVTQATVDTYNQGNRTVEPDLAIVVHAGSCLTLVAHEQLLALNNRFKSPQKING